MININRLALQKKHLIYAIGGGVVLVLLVLVMASGSGTSKRTTEEAFDNIHERSKTTIESVDEGISEDAIWRHQMKLESEAKEQALKDQIKAAEGKIEALQKMIKEESSKEAASSPLNRATGDESHGESDEDGDFLDNLFSSDRSSQSDVADQDLFTSNRTTGYSKSQTLPRTISPIIRHKLRLTANKTQSSKPVFRTTDTIIPATSFVRGVLLSGVDASTSIQASGDPTPVTMRLRDDGHLPRKLKSDLKGCHVLGAARGNLSAERVHIRLEKLVCTEVMTKEIVETDVSGYVVGPDGKNGIRGDVISQEGRYLGRAAVGGVLSGFASVLNPANSYSFGPASLVGEAQKQGKGDLFQKGMYGSVANTTDRLAQYYIDRAEQLQPVIAVPAGVDIELVFTSSVDIGSSNVKKRISEARDEQRANDLKMLWEGGHK